MLNFEGVVFDGVFSTRPFYYIYIYIDPSLAALCPISSHGNLLRLPTVNLTIFIKPSTQRQISKNKKRWNFDDGRNLKQKSMVITKK